MTKERMEELLNSTVDYVCCGERLDEACLRLIQIGFTKDELVNEFGFNHEDVNRAEKEEVERLYQEGILEKELIEEYGFDKEIVDEVSMEAEKEIEI